MSEILGRCVGLLSGDEWRTARSCVEPPFTHKASAEYLPSILKQTENYFRELESTAELSKGLLDPVGDMKMYPFLVTARLVYGELSEEQILQLSTLASEREHLFTYVMAGGIGRYTWSKYLPTKANKLLKKFQEAWSIFNAEAYERAKERKSSAPIIDMWEAALAGILEKQKVRQQNAQPRYRGEVFDACRV